MTLTSVAYKTNEEHGIKYDMTVFTLGEHYTVERTISTYKDGERYIRFAVLVDYRDANENYIPEITVDRSTSTGRLLCKIHTKNYGEQDADEIQKVIAGYQEAVEAVKILEKNFG